MKSRNYLKVALWLVLGLIVASCARTIQYSFYDDFKRTNEEYFTGDAMAARLSLVSFLARVENNTGAVAAERRLNGEFIVGEAWLRLAAICNVQGDTAIANEAMSHAIHHFDKLDNFTSDFGYKTGKTRMLTLFLQKEEAVSPPRWRSEVVLNRSAADQ